MIKKTLAAAIVAGALVFTGASAANADEYTPGEGVCTVAPPTHALGGSSTISCVLPEAAGQTATFSLSDPTVGTVSSIVRAAPALTEKTVGTDGSVAATFTGTKVGTHEVIFAVNQGEGLYTEPIEITVTAAAAPGEGPKVLDATGGEISAAALWVGAGALGLGGLAVVAATARRRAQQR